MRSRTLRPLPLIAALALAGTALAFVSPASAAPSAAGLQHRNSRVCVTPNDGGAACEAIQHDRLAADGSVIPNTAPSGINPADIRTAYNLPSDTSTVGIGQTVAIVDAFDDPKAEADLGSYRAQFGLAPCTTANGCFRKVMQSGRGNKYPAGNGGWAEEISLDLDMVSATCPNCHILLVEATTNGWANLMAAEDMAASLGANAISNSYRGAEFSTETSSSYDSHYNHPGVAITASSGDSGYGVGYPAASRYVTAVGGTSLTRDNTSPRGFTETVWSGSGSGCSAYEPKPSWQPTVTGCGTRTVADVAAVADPNTGVSVYDTYSSQGTGWLVVGGTSASSPLIASVYALGGHTHSSTAVPGSLTYTAPHGSLNDVTAGNNGTCSITQLCQAGPGYDGPTGLGTPNGITGF